jgi:hypothetical protein
MVSLIWKAIPFTTILQKVTAYLRSRTGPIGKLCTGDKNPSYTTVWGTNWIIIYYVAKFQALTSSHSYNKQRLTVVRKFKQRKLTDVLREHRGQSVLLSPCVTSMFENNNSLVELVSTPPPPPHLFLFLFRHQRVSLNNGFWTYRTLPSCWTWVVAFWFWFLRTSCRSVWTRRDQ